MPVSDHSSFKEVLSMLTNPTIDTLRNLRLHAMADAYVRQLQDPELSELDFDERIGLLIDYEWTSRQNRQLNRLLKKAHLKIQAVPEDINYEKNRELDRSLIRQLLTGQWLTSHHNLLITGATGVGKTYLICALATAA